MIAQIRIELERLRNAALDDAGLAREMLAALDEQTQKLAESEAGNARLRAALEELDTQDAPLGVNAILRRVLATNAGKSALDAVREAKGFIRLAQDCFPSPEGADALFRLRETFGAEKEQS